MSNFIEHITIENFKSIQSCHISDCNRINLFIGRPNVGKSNILEALSLFSMSFLWETGTGRLSELIRLEHRAELMHNGNFSSDAVVDTNLGSWKFAYNPKDGLNGVIKFTHQVSNPTIKVHIGEKLLVDINNILVGFESPIKYYSFKHIPHKNVHAKYLIPPNGPNIFPIIENYPELKREVADLFREFNLKLLFDRASQTLKIMKSVGDELFLIPYNSIADTLQRIIFYKAAIASNENSVLLFEEPEAHSFPPYMAHLTQEMIYKKTNQYFITTHSPFILNDLLENGRDELAVFIVHYEDHQTKVRKLSDEELHDVYQNGVDLFTNSESFI